MPSISMPQFPFASTLARAARRLAAVDGLRMAAAMSYGLLLSGAPLVIAIVGIAGLVLDPDAVRQTVVANIGAWLGARAAGFAAEAVADVADAATALPATVLGLVVAFWGASRAFVELQSAFNAIWGVPPPPTMRAGLMRIVRQRAWAFAYVVAAGIILTAALLVNPVLGAVESVVAALASARVDAAAFSDATTFAVLAVLLAVLYRTVPDTRVAWRDVLPGSLAAAGLLVLETVALRLFVHFAAGSAALGVIASPVIGLTLLNYGVVAIYFGAAMTWAVGGDPED